MIYTIVIGICTLGLVQCQDGDSLTVNIAQGSVRGYRDENLYIFYDIPYASVPLGIDKFKAPNEPPTWHDTFEAIDRRIMCHQYEMRPHNNVIQEDCLVTTVFVPDTNATNLPVVVYVHGGAYLIGFGNQMTPANLARSGRVIAVTFNYRLGIHGFLCLGTEKAPGNAGSKDQVALLRWVNKNIASFGGNPNDVTIAGSSAGSTSVDLIMLSDMARGLFNKVIPESGANVAVLSVQLNPLQNARDHATHMGFNNVDDINALEDYYTSASWENLIQLGYTMYQLDSSFYFLPCIERDLGQERFLVDAPVNIIKEGKYDKYPMLYGFTAMEGLFRIDVYDTWKNLMNENFSLFLPADLQFNTAAERDLIIEEVKQFYFEGQLVSDDTVLAYVDYFTDVMFAYGTLRAVKLHLDAGNDNIFLYKYSFDAEEMPSALERLNLRGASHSHQSFAVLDVLDSIPILTNRTREMIDIMRDLWLNFITTGSPTHAGSSVGAWLPVTLATRSPHMSLDLPPTAGGPLLQSRAEFWDSIYERHYRPPQAPSAAHSFCLQPVLIVLYILLFTKTFL